MDWNMRIANHCAPALAGYKPANLISCPSATCRQTAAFMEKQNQIFNDQGIYFYPLHENAQTSLYLVYRRECLLRCLMQPERQAALHEAGFEQCDQLDALLQQLRRRFHLGEFPHEIAYFLGYPLEDIRDFIRFRGQAFCLNGYWKVYHDPDRAQQFFDLYTRCRLEAIAHIRKGGCILDLVHLGHSVSLDA